MTVETTALQPETGPGRPRTRAGKVRLRSLDELDGRTAVSRRTHQLISAIAADLGGNENLSEGARQLIQRSAVLGAFIEDHETRWVAGEKIDLESYLAAVNTQKRVLCALGLQRVAKDITPNLSTYLASLRAEPEEEEAE